MVSRELSITDTKVYQNGLALPLYDSFAYVHQQYWIIRTIGWKHFIKNYLNTVL